MTTNDTTPITVNPSLAKGLRNRFIREHQAELISRMKKTLDKGMSDSPRAGKYYNAYRKRLRSVLGDNLIKVFTPKATKKKDRRAWFYFWGHDDYGLYICAICVTYKNPNDWSFHCFLRVSQHAMDRVFERQNSTDTEILEKEFKPCLGVLLMCLDMTLDTGVESVVNIKIQTANGLAILTYSDDDELIEIVGNIKIPTANGLAKLTISDRDALFVVKTWLADKDLGKNDLDYTLLHRKNKTYTICAQNNKTKTSVTDFLVVNNKIVLF